MTARASFPLSPGAVIGIPGYFDYFYTLNNKGKADLTLQLLQDD